MTLLFNILWILLGGNLSAIGWWITGVLWGITVVGIPTGVQCFKMSAITIPPVQQRKSEQWWGALKVLWLFICGSEMSLGNLIIYGEYKDKS